MRTVSHATSSVSRISMTWSNSACVLETAGLRLSVQLRSTAFRVTVSPAGGVGTIAPENTAWQYVPTTRVIARRSVRTRDITSRDDLAEQLPADARGEDGGNPPRAPKLNRRS